MLQQLSRLAHTWPRGDLELAAAAAAVGVVLVVRIVV